MKNTVTSIGNSAFSCCYRLADIYYAGSENSWSNIPKGWGWAYCISMYYTIHYNCEQGDKPTT